MSLSEMTDEELRDYHALYVKMVEGSKRAERVKKMGFDTKFAYHLIRLCDECEQILIHGDLDLHRAKEYLKAIRAGEVPLEEIDARFVEKDKYLEQLYQTSTLQHSPDENAIKEVLLNCLEHHYGNLKGCIIDQNRVVKVLQSINNILEENRHMIYTQDSNE